MGKTYREVKWKSLSCVWLFATPWTIQSMELKAGGEGDDRGWDGWMASLTWWTWVWVGSGRWWWTGRPGVPQSMGSQRVGHDWATELNWRIQCEVVYRYSKKKKKILKNSLTFEGKLHCLSCQLNKWNRIESSLVKRWIILCFLLKHLFSWKSKVNINH